MATPPTVGASLLLDLDPDTLTGVADGGAVGTWAASTGPTFSNATGTQQPLKRAAVLNGHAAVEFDGLSKLLANTATGITGITAATVVVVAEQTSAPSTAHPGLLSSNAVATGDDYVNSATVGGWYMGVTGTGGTAWTSTFAGGVMNSATGETNVKNGSTAFGTYNCSVLTWDVASASTTTYHANGTAQLTTTSTAVASIPMAYLTLGSRRNGSAYSEWAPVRVARVLIYNARLSTGDRATVDSWVQDTYGITVSDYVLPVVPPTGLTATVISSTEIDLSWNTVTGAKGYDLQRNGTVIATDLTGLSFNDTGLSPSTTYVYDVRSVF